MAQNAYVRHELRSCLNHIRGYSEIILDDYSTILGPMVSSEVATITRNGMQLEQAVQAIFSDNVEPDRHVDAEVKEKIFIPLYEIIGASQALRSALVNQEQGLKDADMIETAASRMLDLTDAFLQKLHLTRLTDSKVLKNELNFDIPISGDGSEGRIMLVDDDRGNLDLMTRHLARQGYDVSPCISGAEAIKTLRTTDVDLVILDLLMPGMNGLEVLETLKSHPATKELPVIIMSASDEMQSIIRSIDLGAEDYILKNADPILLKARVSVSIEKKRLRDNEKQFIAAMLAGKSALEKELKDAAVYVSGLLPNPINERGIKTDWYFKPSTTLGGDSLGYHWIDDDHIALYLVDVSGHGIGAALFAVTIINVLRTASLKLDNPLDPAETLSILNRAFPMEEHNDMFFTMWYGIYSPREGMLKYVNAGSPPAVLFRNGKAIDELSTDGMIAGVERDFRYQFAERLVEPGDEIVLFSDGLYEVETPEGGILGMQNLIHKFELALQKKQDMNSFVQQIRNLTRTSDFDDDVSVMLFQLKD
jgi:sigma-B regulation protein RsbU (phosphoserine phosphatase)